jgi:hypothetical protein
LPFPDRRICLVTSFLMLLTAVPATAQNPSVGATVDASANRHAIKSEYLWRRARHVIAVERPQHAAQSKRRKHTTRYNWQLNADNCGNDWFYEASPTAAPRPVSVATASSRTRVR